MPLDVTEHFAVTPERHAINRVCSPVNVPVSDVSIHIEQYVLGLADQ